MGSTEPAIAVVGSYNVGLVTEVPRFPVPGETVTGSTYREVPGGKGSNQAIGAARLGADAVFIGCVGGDAYAADAFDLWDREGVDASAVSQVETHTGVGTVLVDDRGENEIVVVPGANYHLGREQVADAADRIDDCDVLLVQLEVDDDAVRAAVETAAECGVDVVLNPAPARELPMDVLRNVDYLTPNESEARVLAGLSPDEDVDVGADLLELGVRTVVTTQGGDGAIVRDADGQTHVPTPTVDVVDTTGAGDAFNAAFAVALADGASTVEAARFGCRAGAVTTTEFDVVPALPTLDDIDTLDD